MDGLPPRRLPRGVLLSEANHAFTSPLATLLTLAELLLIGQGGVLDATAKGYVTQILQEDEKLQVAVEKLRDWLEIDPIFGEREALSVAELMTEMLPALHVQAAQTGHALTVRVDAAGATVNIDLDAMERVSGCLLANTLAFTEGPAVLLSAGLHNGQCVFTFSDETTALTIAGDDAVQPLPSRITNVWGAACGLRRSPSISRCPCTTPRLGQSFDSWTTQYLMGETRLLAVSSEILTLPTVP